MANAWALDLRVPLFDRALAEASFSLPPQLKLHGASEKYVLKLALQKQLPREIVWRRKFGMSVPITDWVLGPLAGLIEDLLGPAALARRGLFRDEYVGRLRRGENEPRRDPPAAHRRAAVGAGDAGGVAAGLRRRPRARRPGATRMKCIRCGHDSKYKERPNRTLPAAASGSFAFEPREGDPLTDQAFQNAIDARLRRRQAALGRRAPLLRGLPAAAAPSLAPHAPSARSSRPCRRRPVAWSWRSSADRSGWSATLIVGGGCRGPSVPSERAATTVGLDRAAVQQHARRAGSGSTARRRA